MNKSRLAVILALPLVALVTAPSGCSSDDAVTGNPTPDTGVAADTGTPVDSSTDTAEGDLTPLPKVDDPGAGAILFTASGEVLALGGYDFPPATAGAPAFIDGWEVRFTRLIVTVDKIKLYENPDTSPTDQSKVGDLVAEVDGPWAVDLHKGGPLDGKGGSDEKAFPIAALKNQNKKGGAAFDATKRYAFGFDTVAATKTAYNANLDAAALADYKEMVANGWVVLYVGTATWKGGSSCTTGDSTYDFTKLPKVVNFKFGFKSPTTYVNCQNPDNKGTPFSGEEAQRGIQIDATKTTIGQVTIHTDHPFWESVEHDSPAHIDQIAAHYIGTDPATAKVEDFVGISFTGFKDKNGKNLPWRSCVADPAAKSGQMAFDPKSVPVNPSGTPDKALRDYADYMTYNQSTQGHLNSDGLCFVQRNYPSPP
ncbi:MAG: hypothetical protein ACXVEF_34170 [Polyangiales bacterium]